MPGPEPLIDAAERYFALRRKLGYALRTEREEVLLFARAMDARRRRTITLPLVVDWARSAPHGSERYAAWRYECARRFLAFTACARRGTVVPPPGYLGRTFGRRRPHIYTGDEVCDLQAATRTLTPTMGLRPWTYRTLFGLLYATGLRIGEALALDCRDVDLAGGTLRVRRGKSGPRELPLHRSVVEALAAYRARRDARHPAPRSDALFLTELRGTRLRYATVNIAFRQLLALIYGVGVLSFADARPRGVSGMHFKDEDQWYVGDMLRGLKFERGELHFYADYVRGRMMKTTVHVRPDGTIGLETINRGESAARWVATLQGKKRFSVIEGTGGDQG